MRNLRSMNSVSASVHSPGHAVDAERLHLAADVEDAVVHRVAQARADVAADDLAAALHHEAVHRAGAAEGEDRAALLVDAAAGADAALDHEVAAADGRAGQRAGVAVDHDHARHHVLAGRPAHAAGDVHLWPVDHAAAEVAQAALERDLAAGEDAHADRVLRAGVLHRHVGDALLVQQPAQLEVDLARGQVARVEHRPLAVHLGHLGDLGVRLRQPAGVVGDLALAYRVHTSTSPS